MLSLEYSSSLSTERRTGLIGSLSCIALHVLVSCAFDDVFLASTYIMATVIAREVGRLQQTPACLCRTLHARRNYGGFSLLVLHASRPGKRCQENRSDYYICERSVMVRHAASLRSVSLDFSRSRPWSQAL
jgi:hypothetical protein